jgi:cyclin-dependent kinase 12/13
MCSLSLACLVQLCGTPNEENWPGISKFKIWQGITMEQKKRNLNDEIRKTYGRKFSDLALDLLSKLLALDP